MASSLVRRFNGYLARRAEEDWTRRSVTIFVIVVVVLLGAGVGLWFNEGPDKKQVHFAADWPRVEAELREIEVEEYPAPDGAGGVVYGVAGSFSTQLPDGLRYVSIAIEPIGYESRFDTFEGAEGLIDDIAGSDPLLAYRNPQNPTDVILSVPDIDDRSLLRRIIDHPVTAPISMFVFVGLLVPLFFYDVRKKRRRREAAASA